MANYQLCYVRLSLAAVVFISKELEMRVFVVLGLVLFAAPAFADEDLNQKVGKLAFKDFTHNLAAVGSQIVECDKQKKVLPYDKIRALGLSKEVLKSAIGYHYFNADYLCNKQAISDYLLVSAVLDEIAPDSPLTPEFKEGLKGGDALVISGLVHVFKAKVGYLAIPEKDRAALAEITELDQPFHLHEAIDALVR